MQNPLFIWSPVRRTSNEKKMAHSSQAYSMSNFDAIRKKLCDMNVRATITDTAKMSIATNSIRHTPPILLLFTLWQWSVVRRHNTNIPRSDIFYTWISLLLMAFSSVSALYGYVLLSVQVLIWWMFQLSCIQTITCVYDFLEQYERRWLSHKIHSEHDAERAKKGSLLSVITVSHDKHINVTWFYDLIYMALVPVLSVFSVLLSIWWAANVFDLTDTVWRIFQFDFLNVSGVVQLSILKLVMVGSQFFVFRYLNYLIKALYHKYHKSKIVVNGKPTAFDYDGNTLTATIAIADSDPNIEKTVEVTYAPDAIDVADGLMGQMRRIGQNNYRLKRQKAGIVFGEELGTMESTGRAISYYPDRMNELVAAFRANYQRLPQLLDANGVTEKQREIYLRATY